MTASEVFARYADTFGLRAKIDTLVPAPFTAGSSTVAGHDVRYYRQHYLGVPIEGRGMFVHARDDQVRLVVGQLAHGLATDVTPAVTADQALQTVLGILGPAPRPWESEPARFVAPVPQLTLLDARVASDEGHFVLGWRIRLSASGVPYVRVDVDASTGLVIDVQSTVMGATCPGFDPSSFTLKADASNATADDPNYTSTSLQDSVITSGGTDHHFLYTDVPLPPTYSTLRIPSEIIARADPNQTADDTAKYPTGDAAGLGTLLSQVYCDNDGNYTTQEPANAPARAHWAAQLAERMAANFTFGGKQWIGIGGTAVKALHLIVDAKVPVYTCGSPTPLCEAYSDGTTSCPNSGAICPRDASNRVMWDANLPYTVSDGTTAGIVISPGAPISGFGPPVWLDTIVHEYGHAIVLSARSLWTTNQTSGGLEFSGKGEARAVQEGFSDLLGAAVTRSFDNSATWWKPSPIDLRDMQDPSQSRSFTAYSAGEGQVPAPDSFAFAPDPKPATYKCSPYYDSKNDLVAGYRDATVFNHWAYLMVKGGDGTNECGCAYHVDPLPVVPGTPDPEAERLAIAAKIAFQSLAENVWESLDFSTFAAATLAWTAEGSTNVIADTNRTVAQAWRAVGVNTDVPGDEYQLPKEGEKVRVKFGSFSFGWEAPVSGDWQLQVATDKEFSSVIADVTVPEPRCIERGQAPGTCPPDQPVCDLLPNCRYSNNVKIRSHAVSAPIAPGQTYYWRTRPGAVSAQPWSDCSARRSFSTQEIAPVVLSPALASAGPDTYVTDWTGHFVLAGTSDVVRFYARLSDDPAGTCGALVNTVAADIGADGKWQPVHALSVESSEPDSNNKSQYYSDFYGFGSSNSPPDPAKTYYLEVLPVSNLITGYGPMSESGKLWIGGCSRFAFKVSNFAPPVPVSPGVTGSGAPTVVDQGADVTFVWTATPGATKYHLVLYQQSQRDSQGNIQSWVLHKVEGADRYIDAPANNTGQIRYTLPGSVAANNGYTHVWRVYAVDSQQNEVSTFLDNAYAEYGITAPAPLVYLPTTEEWNSYVKWGVGNQVTLEWQDVKTTNGYRIRAYQSVGGAESELASAADNWLYGAPCADGKADCLRATVSVAATTEGSQKVCFEVWGVNDPCNHFEGRRSAARCVRVGANEPTGMYAFPNDNVSPDGKHTRTFRVGSLFLPGPTLGSVGGYLFEYDSGDGSGVKKKWVPKAGDELQTVDFDVCTPGAHTIYFSMMTAQDGFTFWGPGSVGFTAPQDATCSGNTNTEIQLLTREMCLDGNSFGAANYLFVAFKPVANVQTYNLNLQLPNGGGLKLGNPIDASQVVAYSAYNGYSYIVVDVSGAGWLGDGTITPPRTPQTKAI